MNAPVFTKDQLDELMRAAGPLYDVVRLVDPGECRVLYETGNASDPGKEKTVGDNNRCFSVWDNKERCYDCASYNAAITGRIHEKIENHKDNYYRIVSIPVMKAIEDGKPRSCCIEFIKMLDRTAARSPVNDAINEEFDAYESVSSGHDISLQIMEAAGKRSNTGIVCFDSEGKCIYVNESAFRLFRIRNDLEQMQAFLQDWLEVNYQEHAGRIWLQYFSYGGKEHVVEVQHFDVRDADSRLLGRYFSFLDVTPLASGSDEALYKRQHDKLTGVYNWECFKEKASMHLAMNEKARHMLVRLNIKEFKLVNQLFGLDKGNDVLRKMALMCRDLVGEGDVFGRMAADHFVVLTDEEHFDREQYRKRAMALSDSFGNNLYKLHIQIGIYRIKNRKEDISLMADRAKMAIRSITDDYPVSFAEYNNDMMLNTLYESEVVNSFADALNNDELHIYLQSQNDSKGNVFAAEALARWVHPDQGVIAPEKFIGVLERANMIHELDRHIWEKAVRQLSEWKGTDMENIRLSVNISPKDLAHLDLVEIFIGLVKKYDVSPSKLNLEITETALMADPERCIYLVGALQREGFQVEIDDFGSGYSSLNLLKDVHANILKIDRGFLARTEQEKRVEVILTHIINMARDLNMGVITEGVETRRQLELLHSLGCDMFQGYYFSKPIPITEFERKYF
ncbi:MAG: EAL domain-containing protein [Lachnospiraceae bacterium]|nr:EAL domain-containing protein [Lachnospiraceae bacterium]